MWQIEDLVEEIDSSEFIINSCGDDAFEVTEDTPELQAISWINLNTQRSIAKSLITLNRLIIGGYLRS